MEPLRTASQISFSGGRRRDLPTSFGDATANSKASSTMTWIANRAWSHIVVVAKRDGAGPARASRCRMLDVGLGESRRPLGTRFTVNIMRLTWPNAFDEI